MIRITHHVVPDLLQPHLWPLLEQQLEEAVPRQASSGISQLGRWIEALIGSAGRFAAHGDIAGARRRLSASAECIGAVFTPVAVDGLVHFPFDGRVLSGPRSSRLSAANSLNWILGFCMASSFRNTGVLRALDAYSKEDLAKSGADYDVYADSLSEGMRALFRNDAGWRGWLKSAEVQSRAENLQAPPSIIARYRALIPMLQAIGDKDQSAFDDACVDAVKAHKALYGRGSQKTSPSGAYAILAAGVAALGVDRGLTFNVESGYTPRWLVYGGEP